MSRPHLHLSPGGAASGGGDPTDPEAIVRVLFEKSPLLIYISDLDFKIVLFNRALREATGYDTSDCRNVGGLLERFYPDADYRRLVQDIHDGWVKNEHIRDAELVATIKDGTQRTISWSTSRLRVGRGPTIGYIAIGVDVTTRRNLQQWVTLFQQSLQHLREGVVLTDPEGKVLSWSGGAERILGYTEDEMQARPLKELYLGGERELIGRTVDRAVEAEGRYSGEVELEQKEGGSKIVVFEQFRLDGDAGSALARLTLIADATVAPDLGKQLEEAQTAADDVRAVLDEVRLKLKERDARIEELEAAQSDASSLADTAKTRVGELEQMLAAVEGAADEASKKAESHANDAAVQVALAEGEAADLKDELLTARAELEAANSELGSLRGGADDATRRVAEAEQAAFEAGKRADAAEARAAAAEKAAEDAAKQAVTQTHDELTAAEGRADDAEKALTEARAAADAAQAGVDAATKRAEQAETKLAAAEELVAAAEENRLAAENRAKEQADGTGALEARIKELEKQLAEANLKSNQALNEAKETADAALSEASEKWIQERAALEESHRAAVADVQGKANEERTALEEQLSRDILAAEERSEAERNKMLERHEQERKEWEDAAEIARAEAESRLRHEIEELNAALENTGSLQPHLVQVESMALIAADTEGRVVGWSGGASALDGRPPVEAMGAFIHKDVLRLDKVNWKTLFGKVVVAGTLEQDVTLVDRTGKRHDVQLAAKLVRGDKGQPIGVTEVIRRPEVAGSLQVHTEAAMGRMAQPLHRALEARAIAGLKAHQGASGAVRDLLSVAKAVHEASDWGDVEGAARRVDLSELLTVTSDLVDRNEDAWRELRATAQDLMWLQTATSSGDEGRHRWNELVTRCLHAIEDAAGRRAVRKLGNQAVVEGRGELLIPLVLAAVSPLGSTDAEITVSASVDDDHAVLVVAGALVAGDDATLTKQLAGAAGGSAEFKKRGKKLTLRIPLEPPAAEIELEDDGDDLEDSGDRTAPPQHMQHQPTTPMKAVPEDPDKTVPPSAGVELDKIAAAA